MPADPAARPELYDVSTREGFVRRAVETTDRRIPPRYRAATASHPDVAAWCASFGPRSGSLLILGRTGTGKTTEAYGAIRVIAAKGSPVEWEAVTEPELYARLRPRDGTDSEGEFRRLAGAALLLLDDLGTAKASEWTGEITYRLIAHRYDAMLPCLITSNVPVRQLREMLGDRIASRLREMCAFI